VEDANTPEVGIAQTTPQQHVAVQKIYIKDISFETPNSPGVFVNPSASQPKINFQLNVEGGAPAAENLYEIVLNVTVTVQVDEKTAFLVEVQQAGLFTIVGFEADKMPYLINSYCPSILFPYVRETVSDLVIRGGFPPLLLEPINFDAMFTQQIEQMQQKQQQQAAEQANADTAS
jgi:preprotein translocase subunit SecB